MRRDWALALALAVLTALAYWRAPGTEFIGDDTWRIVWSDALLRQGFQESLANLLPDRPLLTMTIFLNYALGGLNPWGYKVFSLVLHIGVGLVFFALLLRLQKRFFAATDPVVPALFAAVFLAHPLNSQALLSSIQRGVILASLGGLASFLFFLEHLWSRRRVFFLLSLLCYTLGMLSKSFVISVPLIILLYLRLSGEPIRPRLRLLAPFLLISALPVIPYHFWGVNSQEGAAALLWPEYLLVQTRVIWIYLKLYLIPTKLHFFYEIDPHTGLLRNFTWLAIAGHAALLAGAALLVRHRRMLAGFGVFAMYLAFLPESGVFPILHLAFEHRAYFPMLFFLLALFSLSRSFPGAAKQTAVVLLFVAAIFALATSRRVEQVSTLEKWAVDTYRYCKPTRDNNLFLLNCLTAEKNRTLALSFCREMIARDPDFTPYGVYLRMFTYPDAPPREQKETLDLVANALIGSRNSRDFDLASIHVFLSFLIRQTPRLYPEPLARQRALEPVFRNLLPYFLSAPDVFYQHVALHKSNLSLLLRTSESAMGKGELPERDFIQYLNILGTLSIYYPRTVEEIAALSARLKKDYPERASLVDGSEAYYRDLRRELAIARLL